MKAVINFSGGLTSFWAIKRSIEKYGKENCEAFFADTKGKDDTNPHNGEDQDSYRFIKDTAKHFDIPIYICRNGKSVWEVLNNRRAITVHSFAPCSYVLKQLTLDSVINTRYPDTNARVRVFGMNWNEISRMERLKKNIPNVWFPLVEKPYIEKEDIISYLKANNIVVPRLYNLGFEHNNCGGFCVRAGKAHFAKLLETMPERYAYHEEQERQFRANIGDRTILTEQVNYQKRNMTLEEFRIRLQNGDECYDPNDFGACGCFTSGLDEGQTNE